MLALALAALFGGGPAFAGVAAVTLDVGRVQDSAREAAPAARAAAQSPTSDSALPVSAVLDAAVSAPDDVQAEVSIDRITASIEGPARAEERPAAAAALREIASGAGARYGFGVVRRKDGAEPSLRKGVKLDEAPVEPDDAGVVANADAFFVSIPLDADATPSSIENAILRLVESDPARFGVPKVNGSRDMAKVHVEFLPGVGDQADVYAAVFRQWITGIGKNGKPYKLLVDGANLRFHVKIRDGKPVLEGIEGGFAPRIDPEIVDEKFSEDELMKKAAARLKMPRGKFPKFLSRSIMFLDKAWHAVSIYQAEDLKGQAIIVAEDVHADHEWAFRGDDFRSGGFLPSEAFVKKKSAEKSRSRARAPPAAKASVVAAEGDVAGGGVVLGRGTTLTKDGNDHGPTGAMPFANEQVFNDKGEVVAITKEDGSFTAPQGDGRPMTLTIPLKGVYGAVSDGDEKNQPLTAKITVLPGQTVKVTLNSEGDNEELNAVVNSYVYSYKLFHWFKTFLGISDPRLYTTLSGGIHANETSMPGNAFYSPETDGFYLMQRATLRMKRNGRTVSVTFENTAQPSIILHELGHRFIQMASRIALTAEQRADPEYRYVLNPLDPVVGSAVNEAFADMVSMFLRMCPELGRAFRVDLPADEKGNLIRTGENTTKLDPNNPEQKADPHQAGQILMGVGWKSWKDLAERYGLEQGALYAALLFVRTILYFQPGDVASALAHVFLSDMTKDGRLPNADILRKNAGIHNAPLPEPPGKPAA